MPAKSRKQQMAAAIALLAKKRGKVEKLPKNSASRKMATSMTIKQLKKLASTKHEDIIESTESKKLYQQNIYNNIIKNTTIHEFLYKIYIRLIKIEKLLKTIENKTNSILENK